MIFRLLTCLLTCLIVQRAQAQKENNVWYFGYHTGLDFNTTPPTLLLDGQTETLEGSASIAHWRTGELLFYTDRTRVWNREHRLMPNGDELMGGYNTSSQAALIIPFPLDTNKYFVITSDQGGYAWPNEGVHYSVVDMSRENGLGDVTTKNVLLFSDWTVEKLTAVPHANDCDVWVISQMFESNEYVARLIREDGVEPAIVSSFVGGTPNDIFELSGTQGCLVSSPDGTRLAYADAQGRIELLDFDRATGRVSNARRLQSGQASAYGVAFSPDGTKLYATTFKPSSLLQFDVSSDDESSIRATRQIIADSPFEGGSIAPGPDGRLYVVFAESPSIGVIASPNSLDVACGYDDTQYILTGNIAATLGLPNIVSFWVNKPMRPCLPKPQEALALQVSLDTICLGECVTVTAMGTNDRFLDWIVDGVLDATSSEAFRTICFDNAGLHRVTVRPAGESIEREVQVVVHARATLALVPLEYRIDTLGADLYLPLTLRDDISLSMIEIEVFYDTSVLDFAEATDHTGSIVAAQESGGRLVLILNAGAQEGRRSLGVVRFRTFTSADPCTSIDLRVTSAATSACVEVQPTVSHRVCLPGGCGINRIARLLRADLDVLKLSPNPVRDVLEVRLAYEVEEAWIFVLDALGNTVMSVPSVMRGQTTTVDVSSLAAGTYYLQILDGHRVWTARFIKID